ncbi:MAG: SMC family ATPase [Chloroflexota bacterium]
MIPISLSLSGFLSYQDPVEIDFSTFELACIAGANGSGKSSILDGITWALFGKARQGGEAIINTQSEQADVILTFSYEGNIYRIQRTNPRGKGSLLEFHLQQPDSSWKPLTERTMRATQERVEEILRLDHETFVNAAFFLQGKADQFTQQRAGDRKRILGNILGLEVWDTYRQRTIERRKAIDLDIQGLDGRLTEIHSELSEENTRLAHLTKIKTELERLTKGRKLQANVLEQVQKTAAQLSEQRKVVDLLVQKLDGDQNQIDELMSKVGVREKERDTFAQTIERAEEIESALKQWQAIGAELSHWEQVAEKFREHEKERAAPRIEIETEKARLLQELDNLKSQSAEIASQTSLIDEYQSQVAGIQSSIADLDEQRVQRSDLEVELAEAQQRLADAKAENPRLKADMDTLKDRIDQLDQTEGANCPVCEQQLSPDDRLKLIDKLNADGLAMGDRHRANRKLLDEADDLVGNLKSSIADMASLDDTFRQHTRNLDQLTSKIAQIQTAQDSWEKDGALRTAEIQKVLDEGKYAVGARAELDSIDKKLKQIGYDAAAHDAARLAEEEGRAVNEDFRNLEKARAALAPLEREIAEFQDRIASLRSSCQQLQKEYDGAKSSLDEIQAQAPDIRQAQRDLLDLQEEENRLRMDVGAARQKVQVLEELKVRRESIDAQRETLAKKRAQFKQLETAFGKDGVPALLIEQALPQIEANANDILERISGGELSIRFITQRELKTRENLRETLDIQIQDRVGIRDYEMYSGGEAFRVNFAIRLALSEVLSQRAGARLQTLVIDEGFGSQDAIGRQRLVEAINLVKKDFAKILVITHIDSLKDAFPTRLEVEKTAQGSVVNIV